MKKIIFALLLTGTFNLCAYAQSDSTKNASDKLKAYLSAHITEKAYLQFDKPYYAAGDTIYFKAYVTMGERHLLSRLSGVLHVDLINTGNKIDQSIKLKLDSGVIAGDFALPDSLPGGSYRVRAYTQWMRNNNEEGFFYKTIEIGSTKNARIPESLVKPPKVNDKADIQFFPEGGSLVTGLRSKVAFKAIGTNGLGIKVTGTVTDNENKEILSFTSAHLGMGYFYLQPEEGKTYKAKLNYADGTQSTVDLPNANQKGIVLLINNDSIPKASVRIAANNAYFAENKGNKYTLVIYSGGSATTVTCKLDSQTITMDILKRRLHTGIATVTLFSPTLEPLCERLLFIQNYDQLTLNVNSNKTTYTKREKVNIKLVAINRAGNPAAGNFSVSVTDENKVPTDENSENTIITNLLLTSDLKGYVEQPNYYFAETSTTARNNLDILLLTQGYRRFEWKQVLNDSYPPIAYQPEKGLEISGVVKNLFGKPINKGTITLIFPNKGPVLSSVTDDKGIFHFPGLLFTDTAHLVLSAVNSSGKNSTKITWFNDKPDVVQPEKQPLYKQTVPDSLITPYLENKKMQQEEFIKYGDIKGKMLKEVKIKAKKIDLTISKNYGIADQVISGDEIQYGGQLAVRLMAKLRGVHFVPQGGVFVAVLNRNAPFVVPMQVVVNDVEMPLDFDISSINTGSIEKVELMKNATVPDRGVLLITTTFGLQTKDIVSTGVLPITPTGFYKAREFYSPKYDGAALISRQRDLRSTIYWKPEIVTDKDGSALFEYYNADSAGAYKVVIEGIDDKGNIGRQVYRYNVQ